MCANVVRILSFSLILIATAGRPIACSGADLPTVEKWSIFELTLNGHTDGNPYLESRFYARFYYGDKFVKTTGFYDGNGVYRIRFMPDKEGKWRYVTRSPNPELNGKTGEFIVTAPSGNNHGPVRVANTFHFAYADGTPYKELGTTCYVWTHQPEALQEQTLKTLASSPFNKVRFCIFPKFYSWNTNKPLVLPFPRAGTNGFDLDRYNPTYFQRLEKRIADLRDLGIEADIILFHPYDKGRWGFDRMSSLEDAHYLRYVVSRLSAFRNVWWSLANEYDLMTNKTEADFERIGEQVSASDPYHHLLSIHNSQRIFDNMKPWITHASIQNGAAVEDNGRAVLYRDVYRKPVVFDEVKYEGNIDRRWGNLSPEEMVLRFWEGTIAGTYVGHGETYQSEDSTLWWSKGGVLKGQSPARLAFLKQVLADSPAEGIEPIDKWQDSNMGGQAPDYYLLYFGKRTPTSWEFQLPTPPLHEGSRPEEDMKYTAEILDTWNMTVSSVPGVFTLKKKSAYAYAAQDGRSISLPGRPYMAIRIKRVKD